MPRYRAGGALFIGRRLIEPGEVFESDLAPGSKWIPEDAAAKAAVARRDGKAPADDRRMTISDAKAAPEPAQSDAPAGETPIPENWEELSREEIVQLSRTLGAPRNNNAVQARGFIEAEIARRKAAEGSA